VNIDEVSTKRSLSAVWVPVLVLRPQDGVADGAFGAVIGFIPNSA